MAKKIAVLGAGSWGTVLANLLTENGHQVTLWGRNAEHVAEINQHHTNRHYLPKFKLEPTLIATLSLEQALDQVDVILFVIPTNAIRKMAQQILPIIKRQGIRPMLIHASKGLELGTHKRLSQVLTEEIPAEFRREIVVLSGPSHAENVSEHDLTSITAACSNLTAAQQVQQLFMNDYFRVYTNADVIGVEMGAALKNVIALGAGALHGLGYGDNAKAALMTRGLAEISRLGVAFGANPLTFIGLSGVGDLIVTCTSVNSRNWRAGNQLGQGKPLQQVLDEMGMVVEGVSTTRAAYELAQQQGIEMPITNTIYHVLYDEKEIRTAITEIMQREGKQELD
ncbi:NAD(P)H-dependent glycerol-3-phosphate dehydrogenase [Loigolactobacillus bifermentans]|uniref:Glycerol-3-phosphate dehydrogenase [NAD(P)+] n=1 Tax=Loigolactobacillus bifermentans DSM 20003 TaxID=1423726 RepID=A0A0R1H9G5_9LACO|nr:NAD(P)H-dependent glycerol-3-phosphate dehydrogenase [Loigolactobacillus bifermentans]KRK40290.1 glycerol-3-phosphate dehydrogenase [Loigolactobacillus bifermentans DSM 20003]QGG60001.1 NAD(P)H-dependent glycerol-3-phosphate dehydrogenase [Loigolactobacillus bifermentans]